MQSVPRSTGCENALQQTAKEWSVSLNNNNFCHTKIPFKNNLVHILHITTCPETQIFKCAFFSPPWACHFYLSLLPPPCFLVGIWWLCVNQNGHTRASEQKISKMHSLGENIIWVMLHMNQTHNGEYPISKIKANGASIHTTLVMKNTVVANGNTITYIVDCCSTIMASASTGEPLLLPPSAPNPDPLMEHLRSQRAPRYLYHLTIFRYFSDTLVKMFSISTPPPRWQYFLCLFHTELMP